MEKFNSELDLYKKVLPALSTKKSELNRDGIRIVSEKDIWNYNKINKWKYDTDLTLSKLVDDILNTDNKDYLKYKEDLLESKSE